MFSSQSSQVSSQLYVDDVFSSYNFTGNSGTQSINNGVNLLDFGGAVLTKSRSASNDPDGLPWIRSTAAGITNRIATSSTGALVSGSDISSVTSSGFNLGYTNGDCNRNGNSVASWTFRNAPGFFKAMSWSGTGGNQTLLDHGLGMKPGCILIKNASSSSSNWCGWHRGNGDSTGECMFSINQPNSAWLVGYASMVCPSDSTVNPYYVYSYSSTNNGNEVGTQVGYFFAHDPSPNGIIKCVAYAGSGTTTGTHLTLDWEPQWLLIRNIESSVDFRIYDAARGFQGGGATNLLFANNSAVETADDSIVVSATGFTPNGLDLNAAPTQFVYNYTTSKTIAASTSRGTPSVNIVYDTTLGNNSSYMYIFNNHTAGEWISFDLGSAQTVTSLTYRNYGVNWAPTSVKIQYSSDNTSWSDATTYSDNATTSLQTISISSISARYWRIYQNSTTRGNSSGYEWHFNNVRIYNGGTELLGVTGSTTAKPNYMVVAIRRSNKPPTLGTQVFNAVSRWGTNAAATVTGIGFAPDLLVVTQPSRIGSLYSRWVDRLRGPNKALRSEVESAELVDEGSKPVLDVMDGFGISGGSSNWNNATYQYIVWAFKRAVGVFDEVHFKGTGSTLVVPHSLAVEPELIIFKQRNPNSAWTFAWTTWCKHLYSGSLSSFTAVNSNLSAQGGGAIFASTPTSTSFTLVPYATCPQINDSGVNTVAFLFATKPGISKVGVYTGSNGSQTIDCGFTTGARFILIKRTDSSGDWWVWDTIRGIWSSDEDVVRLNSSTASTASDSIDSHTSGFIVNQLSATDVNLSGATYEFVAIA